jgi:hypothetical protein
MFVMKQALALDKPKHLTHCILGWNCNQHMLMARHQKAFFDSALLLQGQFSHHFGINIAVNIKGRKFRGVVCSPMYRMQARAVCENAKSLGCGI